MPWKYPPFHFLNHCSQRPDSQLLYIYAMYTLQRTSKGEALAESSGRMVFRDLLTNRYPDTGLRRSQLQDLCKLSGALYSSQCWSVQTFGLTCEGYDRCPLDPLMASSRLLARSGSWTYSVQLYLWSTKQDQMREFGRTRAESSMEL